MVLEGGVGDVLGDHRERDFGELADVPLLVEGAGEGGADDGLETVARCGELLWGSNGEALVQEGEDLAAQGGGVLLAKECRRRGAERGGEVRVVGERLGAAKCVVPVLLGPVAEDLEHRGVEELCVLVEVRLLDRERNFV